jgi:hypothetical protein
MHKIYYKSPKYMTILTLYPTQHYCSQTKINVLTNQGPPDMEADSTEGGLGRRE